MCNNCDEFDWKKINFVDILEGNFDGHYEEIEENEHCDNLEFVARCTKCDKEVRLGKLHEK